MLSCTVAIQEIDVAQKSLYRAYNRRMNRLFEVYVYIFHMSRRPMLTSITNELGHQTRLKQFFS